jgi:hypothetical protein
MQNVFLSFYDSKKDFQVPKEAWSSPKITSSSSKFELFDSYILISRPDFVRIRILDPLSFHCLNPTH